MGSNRNNTESPQQRTTATRGPSSSSTPSLSSIRMSSADEDTKSMGVKGKQGGRRSIPPWTYLGMAICLLLSFGLSNASLLHLNYPTKVILKSSKLIPVMLLGVCRYKKRYGYRSYLVAILLIVGVVVFTLGRQPASSSHPIAPISSISRISHPTHGSPH